MISSDIQCKPEEDSLYDVVAYAIWGLSDSCSPNKLLVYGFLEDLADEEFSYVSGEPGWSIIRLTLATFKNRFSENPFDDKFVDRLNTWRENGESTAYFIDHCDVTPRESIYSSEVFWRAVRKSLLAFAAQHPERQPEVEEGFRRFTELGAFPGPANG